MKTDDTFEPLRDAAQRAPALRLLLAVSLHMEKGLVVDSGLRRKGHPILVAVPEKKEGKVKRDGKEARG